MEGGGGDASALHGDRARESRGEGVKLSELGLVGSDSASDSVIGEQSHVKERQGRFAV